MCNEFPTILYLCKKNMDHLPHDPAILLSSVNMFLRDEEFDSLEQLCYCYNEDLERVKAYMLQHGYVYSEAQKQFRPVGFDRSSASCNI